MRFRYHESRDTLDIGGHAMASTQMFRNVTHDRRCAFVVDDVVARDPWRIRCVEIRGLAETLHDPDGPWPGTDGAIIRIPPPRRVVSFGLDDPDRDPSGTGSDVTSRAPNASPPGDS